MFNELSNETKRIWDYMESLNKEIYGTNDLLWALINISDGMFAIILQDYKIPIEDINEYINNTLVISYEDGKYTKKLLEVYEYAKNVAKSTNEEIYEEHLIYAILKVKDTIAYNIIKYYIKDIDALANEYNQIFDLEQNDTILINLTKLVKTKEEKFIGRKKLLDRIISVLHKKKKNNPLLIGSAGVGKSSLVEEVARIYLQKYPEYTIYQLDISSVISGTKYRGDLEEKLLNIIEKVKRPYTILFIDEIHNIVKQTEESPTMDIGNILKPILSRGEISLIGATTLDEYYETIASDKALARRFSNIFIEEASSDEAYSILKGIKKEYEKYYNVKYSDKILKYIIIKSKLITNRYMPDKAIDILDESGLITKNKHKKEVSIDEVDKVVFNTLGQDIDEIKDNLNRKIKFPRLKYYINNYLLSVIDKKEIGIFKVKSPDTTKELISDLKRIFNLKDEMILQINMARYKTTYEMSNLFGSSKGYVGYSSGGIISEHLVKYPFNILVIQNLNLASSEVINQIEGIIKQGEFIDSKSRKIYLKNTIVIFEESSASQKSIGFLDKKEIKKEFIYDEEFETTNHNYYEEINELLNHLAYHNYHFEFTGKTLTLDKFELIKTKLLDINNFEKNKGYTINEEGIIA